MILTPVVGGHPSKPSRADGGRELSQRDHAEKAQLKPWTERVGWIMKQHGDRREGKDCIAVPIAFQYASARAEDRHQRGAHRTRRRRHHPKRDECGDRNWCRSPTLVADKQPRHPCDHPSEYREVESRYRQDVRQPDGAKAVFDRSISVFHIA